jgi:hypothetical protein
VLLTELSDGGGGGGELSHPEHFAGLSLRTPLTLEQREAAVPVSGGSKRSQSRSAVLSPSSRVELVGEVLKLCMLWPRGRPSPKRAQGDYSVQPLWSALVWLLAVSCLQICLLAPVGTSCSANSLCGTSTSPQNTCSGIPREGGTRERCISVSHWEATIRSEGLWGALPPLPGWSSPHKGRSTLIIFQ